MTRLIRLAAAALSAGLCIAGAAAAQDDLRAAQLQDLEVIRTQYLPKEMAYSPAARAMAEAALDALARRAGSLSPAQFVVGVAEAAALSDNGHSGARLRDPRVMPAARLPLRLLWAPDALIVARAFGPATALVGAQVLKIEGRAPESVYDGAKGLLGGNDAARKAWLPDWIEAQGVLNALGMATSPDAVTMTLRLRDGREVERTIPMLAATQTGPAAQTERLWSPEPAPGESGWTSALPVAREPLYARDADRPFRMAPMAGLPALYVQFRENEDEAGERIGDFTRSVSAAVRAQRPRNLVLDLRFDVGGNLLTTLSFMRSVSQSVPGRTYLLVGPYTFSAGIISAAAVKQGGGARVTIVGDGVGDRPHFWSEGAMVKLPNSHLSLRFTNGQFNLKEGCHGEPACMDDRFPINVNFTSLEPDIRAPLTAEAWLAGRDPGLEAVVADIRRRGGR